MSGYARILSSICLQSAMLYAIQIGLQPIAVLHTPNSILQRPQLYKPLTVYGRSRYATCTSVAWVSNEQLITLNLYGQQLIRYQYTHMTNTILQRVSPDDGACLGYPEHSAINHDSSLLLIANSYPASIALYTIVPSGFIDSKPVCVVPHRDMVHNVRFSPDGKYCACTVFDKRIAYYIYRIMHNQDGISLQQVCCGHHALKLRAKAIQFTHNGQYMILAFAYSINASNDAGLKSLLEVYSFNPITGLVGECVSHMYGNRSLEDCVLTLDQKALIATDQAHDALVIYPFDPQAGSIGPEQFVLMGTSTGLTFPHGLSISPDGTILAVSNYGDDSVKFYALH